MKIEDHSTAEIHSENFKRSRACFSCGLKQWEKINDYNYRENKIGIELLEPAWKRVNSKEVPNMEYLCKNCSNKMHQQWQVEGIKRSIKLREDEIKKIKKPNCDKCQINAMHNPSHSICGNCGAPAYNDCVCDLYFIEDTKITLEDVLSGRKGPMGYQRTGGIICISYSYELIFTCPVHGGQEGKPGDHYRNKFYKQK